MLRNILSIGIAVIVSAFANQSWAENRMALVIGNSNYTVGPLKNPVNDAALMAETLRDAGFKVTHQEDLRYRELQRSVVIFGRELQAAGKDTVGLVFYAGHAVQADGENYVIPVDADIRDALDLEIQALPIDTLMRSLETAGNRLNIVVLDACRNNPFQAMSRSGSRGLAKIDAAHGTLLAYSTAPGDVASDGDTRNSPYTRALARAIRTPDLPVEQVFKQVRIEVMERTGERQIPWESSSLTGDFTFFEGEPDPVVTEKSVPDDTAEIEYWKAVAEHNSADGYRGYLSKYPDGLFVQIAHQRLSSLEAGAIRAARQKYEADARAAWDAVKDSDDPAMLQTVADHYSDTLFADLARLRIDALNAPRASQAPTPATDNQSEILFWESIKSSPNKADYEAYLAQFPDGTFAAIALSRAANGYQPLVAALTPTDTGETWRIDWRTIQGTSTSSGNLGWCIPNESAKTEFRIRDGQFSFDIEGTRYSRTTLTGRIDGGTLTFSGIYGGNGSAGGDRFEVELEQVDDGRYAGRVSMRPVYNLCLWKFDVTRLTE